MYLRDGAPFSSNTGIDFARIGRYLKRNIENYLAIASWLPTDWTGTVENIRRLYHCCFKLIPAQAIFRDRLTGSLPSK